MCDAEVTPRRMMGVGAVEWSVPRSHGDMFISADHGELDSDP